MHLCVGVAWLLVVFAVVSHALPSPLTGSAQDRLLGSDCSQWCFNGTDTMQPEVFGVTNSYCPDSRGCEWQWRLSFAPCSLSLLDFEARIGPDRVEFSHVDPAAAAALGFYCSESDASVVLELRPHGDAPIMTWHYAQTSCEALMSDFGSQMARFQEHETAVEIAGSRWFSTGAERLEEREIDCNADSLLHGDQTPCQQCFRGVEELNLPSSGWADVCGAGASTCQAEWRFCYDVCVDRTSKQAIQIGSQPLRIMEPQVADALHVVCGQVRGLTVVALTDADDAEALDDGEASVYALWEYRAADCTALWRSPRRADLFLRRHFALEREGRVDAAGASVPPSQLSHTTVGNGGLDDRVWYSAQSVHDSSSGGSRHYSSLEIGLIVGIALIGAVCLVGWAIVALYYFRSRPAYAAVNAGIELVATALNAGGSADDDSHGAHRREMQQRLREHDAAEDRDLSYIADPDGEKARREAAQAQRQAIVEQLQ